jgi:hypothetical protein
VGKGVGGKRADAWVVVILDDVDWSRDAVPAVAEVRELRRLMNIDSTRIF